MAEPRAIIFDLDGTLVDSLPGVALGVRHALRQLGRPEPDDTEMRRWIGPPLEASFARALGVARDHSLVAEATAHYRESYTAEGVLLSRPFDGMVELVRDLAAAGRTLVIGTTKQQDFARQIVGHIGLGDAFRHVAGRGDHLPGVKDEKVEVFESLAPHLPAGGADTLAIGDTRFDVVAGAAIGVPVIGVTWGYGTPADLAGCRQLVHTVDELRATLLVG